MTLVRIEPGTFTMGDPGAGIAPRRVTLTRALFMADREVSVDLFSRFFVDPRPPESERLRAWPGADPSVSPTLDCPVNNVTWAEMLLFCNWLSRREGRRPCYERTGPGPVELAVANFEADGYRLPTAAEWEYRRPSRDDHDLSDRRAARPAAAVCRGDPDAGPAGGHAPAQ